MPNAHGRRNFLSLLAVTGAPLANSACGGDGFGGTGDADADGEPIAWSLP